MACQRPQCGEGGSGAGDSSSTAVPLGAFGARESNAAKSEPKSKRSVEALEAEIRRLRVENAKLLEQREVLKKSLGMLSEAPPRGMPESNR